MINRYLLKIGLSDISIDLVKTLDQEKKNIIDRYISELYINLNNRISESSAYRFNKAQINIPIFVTSEFIEYIEWVNKIYKKYDDLFKPFNLKGTLFLDNVIIDKNSQTIIKLSDFEFESSYFKKEFILLQLIRLLKKLDIDEYLINFKSLFYSKGYKYWKIKYKTHTSQIKNEYALYLNIDTDEINHDKLSVKKFGALNDDLNNIKGFLIGDDIVELSINSKHLKFINSKSSLIKFLKERDLKLDSD